MVLEVVLNGRMWIRLVNFNNYYFIYIILLKLLVFNLYIFLQVIFVINVVHAHWFLAVLHLDT